MSQEINLWLIGGGLGLGALFGIIVQRSRLCSLAAMANWVLMRDLRQTHGYLAALAVAALGTAILEFTGLVPVADSFYRAANINWLGALAGGAVFGFGMVLAGGCVGRLLVRGAEGSAGSLLALGSVAIGAAACAYGIIAPARIALTEATAVAARDASLSGLLGLPFWIAPVVVVTLCVLAIAPAVRRKEGIELIISGALIGALVVGGWFVTGHLARDEFDAMGQRPASLAFAAPLAQTAHYLASGEILGNMFHLALMIGALVGAYASAAARGGFRWRVPSGREIARVSTGGALMGVGGVFAGGCNIGQGLSGLSTCSSFSLLAVAGIVIGLRFGLVWLMRAENAQAKSQSRNLGSARAASETG